jgi:hypothetical protein
MGERTVSGTCIYHVAELVCPVANPDAEFLKIRLVLHFVSLKVS